MIIDENMRYEIDESFERKDIKISLRVNELSTPKKAINKCIFLVKHIKLAYAHDDRILIKFYNENKKEGFGFEYCFDIPLEKKLSPILKMELITSIVVDIKKFE